MAELCANCLKADVGQHVEWAPLPLLEVASFCVYTEKPSQEVSFIFFFLSLKFMAKNSHSIINSSSSK